MLSKYKDTTWFGLIERYGLPTVAVVIMAIAADFYWLRPARRERVEDRIQLAKERAEDRTIQQRMVDNQISANVKLQGSLEKFSISINELSSVIRITNDLIRTNQTQTDVKLTQIANDLQINRERIQHVDELISEAARIMLPVSQQRAEQTRLLGELKELLLEIKRTLETMNKNP